MDVLGTVYSSRLHDVDVPGIVYSEPHRAVQEEVHGRMFKAQEVAVSQLVVPEVRHRVTTDVEQYEGCHPLRILKSEIIIMTMKNSTNKRNSDTCTTNNSNIQS